MINILNYLPPEANLSISLEQYQTFLEIAKQQERERIIKELENSNKLCTEKTVCIEADEGYPCNCEELIALIKGDKNEL